MNDLIKRLRAPWFTNGCAQYQIEAADRLTAMKAAGDGLAGFAGHDQRCEIMTHGVWTDPIPCTCGLTAALKQWKEASDGL